MYFYHSLQDLSVLFRDTQVYQARRVISKQPSHIIRNVGSKLHYILSGWNQHILSYWNWFLCEWWTNVWKIHPRIKYRELRELRESSQRKRIVMFWMSTMHKELQKQIFIMKRNTQNKLFFSVSIVSLPMSSISFKSGLILSSLQLWVNTNLLHCIYNLNL